MAILTPAALPEVLKSVSAESLIFTPPVKRIFTASDLTHLPSTPAYNLLTTFLSHLTLSISPYHTGVPASSLFTNAPVASTSPDTINNLISLLQHLQSLIAQAPPLPSPTRRFGSPSFRTFHSFASAYLRSNLAQHIPSSLHPALPELTHYIIASLGSPQRLDYGTGHELEFLAFVAGIWKLGGLRPGDEKAIVLQVFDAYFTLIRKLVVEYNLEPAGSHGVWGLDDHFFLPYIFGASQLTTYAPSTSPPEGVMVTTGDVKLPFPADVTKPVKCEEWKERNMYFAAVGFVHEVKKGPFWEHSPMLYDISGVQKGWGKVGEGMKRMWEVEVCGKVPVVQHFWFGSGLFVWDGPIRDPDEMDEEDTRTEEEIQTAVEGMANTKAPWANVTPGARAPPPAAAAAAAAGVPTTTAPWANTSRPSPSSSTSAPWASNPTNPSTRAPPPSTFSPTTAPWANSSIPSSRLPMAPTTAPWASRPSPEQARSPPQASPPLRDPFAIGPADMMGKANEMGKPIQTTANLGPVRVKSPDSAAAMAEGGGRRESGQGRSDSIGAATVAEKGDLKELRERRRSSAVTPVAAAGVAGGNGSGGGN